uniref:Uncharacterized protein n=1 Tax=Brassica oleracea var. oleracea TaxID=109376 RepID=A0A0D2ZRP4_BRAOL
MGRKGGSGGGGKGGGGGGGGGGNGGGGGGGSGGGSRSGGGGKGSGGSGGGYMVAPGSNGSSYISRDNFESDPKGYFDNLHGSGQGFPASRVIPLCPVRQRSTSPGRALPGLDRTQYRFGVQKRQGSFRMEGESNPDGGCHHRPVPPLGLPRPDI